MLIFIDWYHHLDDCVTFIFKLYYLGCKPLGDFSLHVTGIIRCLRLILYPFKYEKHLCYCFWFKVILLNYIQVGNTKINFCERSSFNPFISIFVHFTILFLTWYDFTSYSIVLTTSNCAWFFQPGSIVLVVLFNSLLK